MQGQTKQIKIPGPSQITNKEVTMPNKHPSGVCPDYRRLDRIEEKIDKLSDLLITLARTEERVIGLEEDKKSVIRSIEVIEKKINALENSVGNNSRTVASVNKLVWTIMTIVLTGFMTWIISFPLPN